MCYQRGAGHVTAHPHHRGQLREVPQRASQEEQAHQEEGRPQGEKDQGGEGESDSIINKYDLKEKKIKEERVSQTQL